MVIDGTDVTMYAAFEAGRVRYESGDGVVRSDGEHWAEVQRVTLPADEIEYEVLDSFPWAFRVS